MNCANSGLLAQLGPDVAYAVNNAITSEPLMNSIRHVSKAEPNAIMHPAMIVWRSFESVHGALSDHHRLMWQFGAVPLMYYLIGET